MRTPMQISLERIADSQRSINYYSDTYLVYENWEREPLKWKEYLIFSMRTLLFAKNQKSQKREATQSVNGEE